MLEEIERALNVLIMDDQITELRAFGREKREIVAGFFKYKDVLARRAHDLDSSGKYKGIHITLNPVSPSMYELSPENVTRLYQTTSDKDIVKRVWFPVDVDPVRKSGTSATNEEHELAIDTARKIVDFMKDIGWPEPVIGDSGNGAHLLWRIDLPNDEESHRLLDKCLRVLAELFNNDKVNIDTSVANASRIWKLYGTMARKGENTQERPWRMSSLISVPEKVEILSQSRLESLASILNDKHVQSLSSTCGMTTSINVRKWLEDHGYTIYREKDGLIGKIYVLDVCPMNSEHTDRSACVIQCNNGRILFKCHHNHCKDYTWKDVLEKHGEIIDGITIDDHTLSLYDVTKPDRKDPSILRFSPTKAANAMISLYRIITDERNNEMWIYEDGIYTKHASDIVDRTLNKVAGDLYTINASRETIRKIQTETRQKVKWNPNPNLFGIANGVLNLENGEILKYSPDMYLTIKSPVIYDPDADCPEIKKFLKSTLASDDDILTLIDILCAMSRSVASGYFLVMIGPGGNGKKVVEQLMTSYVGFENMTSVRVNKLDNDRFARMELMNKRLLINSEVSGEKAESDWIKLIATGDITNSDVKFKERIQFEPFCFQVFDTNTGQKFHDNSRGFTRRILKIDFPYVFVPNPDPSDPFQKKEDPDIVKKVTAQSELSGLLNIVIKRAPEVIRTGHIYHKKTGNQMADEYYMQSNSISEFVDKFLVFDPHGPFTLISDIYDAYTQFCAHINATPKRAKALGTYISKTAHRVSRVGISDGKRGRGYEGVMIDHAELLDFIRSSTKLESSEYATKIVSELFDL